MVLTKSYNFQTIQQYWQVALISTLINKTKMFEYGANFILHMEIVWNFNWFEMNYVLKNY